MGVLQAVDVDIPTALPLLVVDAKVEIKLVDAALHLLKLAAALQYATVQVMVAMSAPVSAIKRTIECWPHQIL